MSPEQALGDPTDLRSDIYQMGVILFQLLTRRLPFEAATAIKMMLKHVEQPAPAPSRSRAERGPAPSKLICYLRALKKKPDERFHSARDMRAELRAAVPSAVDTPLDPLPSPTRRDDADDAPERPCRPAARAPGRGGVGC